MPSLVKEIVDEDGLLTNDDSWHLVDPNPTPCLHVLCTGSVLDGDTSAKFEHKDTGRGGITCPKCINLIKAYKAVKL